MTRYITIIIIVLMVVGVIAYLYREKSGGKKEMAPPPLPRLPRDTSKSIKVTVKAFAEGERISIKYTCEGSDISPEINIDHVPDNAKSLILIVYDPDAPIGWFTHWILYNIPPHATSIPEAAGKKGKATLPGLGIQGTNDFGIIGYGGPCPPRGHGVHRYVFMVLALDIDHLDLDPGANYKELIDAARTHIIAYGYTYGTYSR